MSTRDFSEVVDQIRKEDPRYEKGAYFFVRQALDHTLKSQRQETTPRPAGGAHVSGPELLAGVREYALDQYGPMAYALLEGWGVKRCQDFGDIVFHLVDYGVLGKTEHDRREDFAGGYDFREAFVRPFEPALAHPRLARLRFDEAEA
jgi:uncharacterized repeat protein (TIGR04138 family)